MSNVLNAINFVGPIRTSSVKNLVTIKEIMRDLKEKMRKVNESICKRQSCLNKWTTLFGNECYANEVS